MQWLTSSAHNKDLTSGISPKHSIEGTACNMLRVVPLLFQWFMLLSFVVSSSFAHKFLAICAVQRSLQWGYKPLVVLLQGFCSVCTILLQCHYKGLCIHAAVCSLKAIGREGQAEKTRNPPKCSTFRGHAFITNAAAHLLPLHNWTRKKEPLHREEPPPKTVINSKFIIYFY